MKGNISTPITRYYNYMQVIGLDIQYSVTSISRREIDMAVNGTKNRDLFVCLFVCMSVKPLMLISWIAGFFVVY